MYDKTTKNQKGGCPIKTKAKSALLIVLMIGISLELCLLYLELRVCGRQNLKNTNIEYLQTHARDVDAITVTDEDGKKHTYDLWNTEDSERILKALEKATPSKKGTIRYDIFHKTPQVTHCKTITIHCTIYTFHDNQYTITEHFFKKGNKVYMQYNRWIYEIKEMPEI